MKKQKKFVQKKILLKKKFGELEIFSKNRKIFSIRNSNLSSRYIDISLIYVSYLMALE